MFSLTGAPSRCQHEHRDNRSRARTCGQPTPCGQLAVASRAVKLDVLTDPGNSTVPATVAWRGQCRNQALKSGAEGAVVGQTQLRLVELLHVDVLEGDHPKIGRASCREGVE